MGADGGRLGVGRMDDRQLGYFITVAEEKSLGRAAMRLPISLSALSRQIMALEQELEVQLFIRTLKGLELTQAGEIWLAHAHAIRAKLGRARQVVSGKDDGLGLKVDIGVPSLAWRRLLDPLLDNLSRTQPKIELALHQMTAPGQIAALREGRILAAFNNCASLEKVPGLRTEMLSREKIWFGMSSQHRLAGSSTVSLADFRDDPWIGGQDHADSRADYGCTIFLHHGFQPRVGQQVSDGMAGLGVIACGLGVSLLPESMQALHFPGVVFRPLLSDAGILPMGLDCVYRENESSPLLAALLESVRSCRAIR